MNIAPALLLASMLAPVSAASTDAVNHSLRTSNGVELSSNWSGYGLVGAHFTEASGVFTVPSCDGAGDASEWVGVDGDNNNDLIQAGVDESSFPGGGCNINAWWEILPAASVDIGWMKVSPGDQVRVSIHHEPADLSAGVGPWAWGIDVLDLATGKDFWQQFNYGGPAKSAEWIVEAPTVGWTQSNIMPYQSVTWSGLLADGRTAALARIWLVQNGAEMSVPSAVGTTAQLMRQGFSTVFVGM